jgi:predicted helicase
MDDESVFGPTFYSLSFGQAVEQDLLSDYRLVVLQVKESQVTSLFLPGEGGTIDENARIVGSLAALSKKSLIKEANDFSTDPEPMKRAVVFCSRIKESEQISKLYNSLIEPEFLGRDYFEKNGFVIPDSQSISGLDNSDVKMKKLNWLRDQVPGKTCRMLVNARCLSEGVDVPTLDAVVFMAKKRSQVDIIQAVGRVMRKVGTGAQKKYGYIILPVVIKDEQLTDKTLDSNDDFRVVWQVVQALRSHDERFDVQINKFGFTKELPPNIIVTDAFVPPRSSKKDGQYVDRTEVVEGTDDDFNGREMVQTTLPLPDPEDIKKNEGLFAAALVRHCGNRLYWDDWSKNIGDVTNHCAIEIQKLVTENPSCKKEFAKFERGLKDILNPYITDEDAVSMLAEHMVTLPVFTALFSNVDFVSQNVVTKIMQSMINKLYDAGLSRETDKLKDFYDSVKEQVSGIDSSESKQALVKKLYEKFFQHALPMAQTKFGIVYTPTEIVDFIINSVESVLKSEFKESLSAPGVKILDPFTGTGTFIIELLKKLKEEGIDKEQLLSKYQNDIWCNEIMLLAYYIALINIEDVFGGYYGSFVPFQHAVLTDTFQMAERGHSKDVTALVEDEEFAKASAKEKEEAASEIRVIIANPPYSVGQRNANDNNANNKYASIDEAIAKTYLSGVKVTNVNSLYDSYVRSFRWASDRISKKGVVAYVSNGSFIDNLAFSGFRASLLKEFQHVYVFNLRGNCRTQGLARQKEKGNVFGEGSRTTIAITILVKNEGSKFDGFVHYHDIGDYLSREDKLDIVKKTNDISAIKWEKLYLAAARRDEGLRSRRGRCQIPPGLGLGVVE